MASPYVTRRCPTKRHLQTTRAKQRAANAQRPEQQRGPHLCAQPEPHRESRGAGQGEGRWGGLGAPRSVPSRPRSAASPVTAAGPKEEPPPLRAERATGPGPAARTPGAPRRCSARPGPATARASARRSARLRGLLPYRRQQRSAQRGPQQHSGPHLPRPPPPARLRAAPRPSRSLGRRLPGRLHFLFRRGPPPPAAGTARPLPSARRGRAAPGSA